MFHSLMQVMGEADTEVDTVEEADTEEDTVEAILALAIAGVRKLFFTLNLLHASNEKHFRVVFQAMEVIAAAMVVN